MKIRIQGNSIRFRLKKSEVESFAKYGSISESIHLGKREDEMLSFGLQVFPENEIKVQYQDRTTTIQVPLQLAEAWTGTNRVGFDGIIEIGNEMALKVLVEKDFKCLDGTEAENVDSYPNPKESC